MSSGSDTDRGPRARSPLVAVLLSGIFPGLGQLYNRQRRKALLFLVGAVLTGVGPLSPLDVNIDLDDPVAGLRTVLLYSLPFLALALWSVLDAYRVAQRSRK
jgi:hypothetical protein